MEGFVQRLFCPYCDKETIQSHVHTQIQDDPCIEGGRIVGYDASAEYVFTCSSCKNILLYATPWFDYSDDFGLDEDELLREAFELGSEVFAELVWPNLIEDIHAYIPDSVKKRFLSALKNIRSPKLFALEIRQAFEAICDEPKIPQTDINDH